MKRLIILDRDGVINQDSDHYIKSVEEFIPIPGSLEAIARLCQANFSVRVATNQSGIARGLFTLTTLEKMHEKLQNLLSPLGGKIDGFTGRGRKPQMALAAHFGFKDYAQPAGGCCMLTDENYAHKLRDMWTYRPTRKYELDDIIMLKMGRHFRFAPHLKIIIGREEGENNFMQGYKNQFVSIFPSSHLGALCLVDYYAHCLLSALKMPLPSSIMMI